MIANRNDRECSNQEEVEKVLLFVVIIFEMIVSCLVVEETLTLVVKTFLFFDVFYDVFIVGID